MFTKISRWLSWILLSYLGLFLLTPMAVHADGGAPQRAYIANATNRIGIIDISKQKVIAPMVVSGDPHTILLSLDGRFLYATEPQLKRLAVITASTGETFCTTSVPGHPTLLAADFYASLLFIASNDTSIVTSIDPKNCHLKHIFHVNKPIYGLAVATALSMNSSNQLWIADSTGLTIFDDTNGMQIKQISIPGGPRYISIPFEATVDVATQQGSVVSVDPNTYKVTTLISGGSYSSMDFDENTGEVYVPDQKNNQLVILAPIYVDSAWHQGPLRTVLLEAKPVSVAVTSDGQLAFVALENGKVAMLDIPAHQIINTFDVGGNPHFIITGLNPPPSPLLTTTPKQIQTQQPVFIIVACVVLAIFLLVVFMIFR